MNNNWKSYLIAQGATITETDTASHCPHFGNSAAEKEAALNAHVVCDISHYGLLRANGEDAESFLQNQFCNDVRKVTTTLSQLNGYCTPKGRALALFRLFKQGDDYVLRLPQEILEPLLKRLRMFVMMSKVTLQNANDEQVSIGYSGPDAAQRLADILGSVPTTNNACQQINALSVIRVPGPQPRFEIHGSEPAVRALWEQLAQQAQTAGSDAWQLLDILAGLPDVVTATQEAFVPQMVNLQALDALSFHKGCYPGQEIVARMRYLGKVKRRMYLAHADTDSCPQPGDSLFAAGSESAQGVGKIVQAQTTPSGGVELLAVIEIASAEQRSLHLTDANGPALTLRELPYSLEEEQPKD